MNNTGADQPAHPRSLISAVVIHLLESIISRLAASGISIFKLVAVAWAHFTGNPEDRFCRNEAQMLSIDNALLQQTNN